jgi:hypothetical protein
VLLITLIVAANVGLALSATLPLFVTYAPVPTNSVDCSACNTPDVQNALRQTAEYWIEGFSAQRREHALIACGAGFGDGEHADRFIVDARIGPW